MKTKWIAVLLIGMLSVSAIGCGDSEEVDKENVTEQISQENSVEEKKGFFDASYEADTTVAYSAGNDGSWAYGNQRKEFPKDKACYVRIGSTVKTDKKSGVDGKITVIYRFTGTDGCEVKLTDGIAQENNSAEPNTKEFIRTLYAKKGKDAKEDVVIFQYQPQKEAEGITIEVIYDERIEERYDVRNSIYFTSEQTTDDNSTENESVDDSSEKKKANGIN